MMASVKKFLFISFFNHYSLRGIDFFVSREYMILSTFVVTELQREWESGKKMLVFKVIITSESHSPKSDVRVNN